MLDLDHRPTEHWAYLSNPRQANNQLAIFVHGFIGNYLTTWGRLPSLLEQKAEGEAPFDKWDCVFLGYATKTIESYLDVADILRTNIENAFTGEVGFKRPYTRVALFGHSLGTLGIRQLLCAWELHKPDFLPHIHSVTFFGTPLNGSPLAFLRPILRWWPILDGLRPNSPQLRMLSVWTNSLRLTSSGIGRPLATEARHVVKLHEQSLRGSVPIRTFGERRLSGVLPDAVKRSSCSDATPTEP